LAEARRLGAAGALVSAEAGIAKLASADARFMVILTAIFAAATAAIVHLR